MVCESKNSVPHAGDSFCSRRKTAGFTVPLASLDLDHGGPQKLQAPSNLPPAACFAGNLLQKV